MIPSRSFLATFLLCLGSATADIRIGSDIPLPHADELEGMIKKHIFPNKKEDETFAEYFDNNDLDADNDTMALLGDLDFSVLDADGLRNILKLVKHREAANATSARRQTVGKWEEDSPFYDQSAKHLFNKTIDLMKQSIYSTRYIIERTKHIRGMYDFHQFLRVYRTSLVYQIGVLYGYVLEMKAKADNCLSTMAYFDFNLYKFGRFLWLYERLITLHVDSTDALQRMFILQAELDKPTTVVATTTESGEDVEDP